MAKAGREPWLIGVDVGATYTVVAVAGADGRIRAEERMRTPRMNPEVLVDAVAASARRLMKVTPGLVENGAPPRLGVGICGLVDPGAGTVRSPIALGWPDPVPMTSMLSRALDLLEDEG